MEDVLGGLCSMGVGDIRVLVRNPEWNKPCGRHVKMNVRELGWLGKCDSICSRKGQAGGCCE
jgi:hypothetical protein